MNDWNEKVKAAHAMVSALCLPRGSKGSREWIMSIPARPDYDPDLVITSGLMAAEKRIKELEAQLAACAAGPWRYDVENAPKDGSNVLLAWIYGPDDKVATETLQWNENIEAWTNEDDGYLDKDRPFAFAVPNPPQVKP